MMNIGFNIIEKNNPELFGEQLSIVEFLKRIADEEFPLNFAINGLDALLYYTGTEDRAKISKFIRNTLQDHANSLVRGNYIVQVVIDGNLYIVESSDKPRVKYKEEELLLNPVLGKVKQIDTKHFLAPLNLQS
ncbi:hypothetical protein ACFLU8_04535 [Chloroflexota bacterium]